MKYPKQIRVPLTEKMSGQLDKLDNKVQFIREAIQEKLTRKFKEDETLSTMIDQIKKMDPLALHGAISDLVYTAQVIFKENKKQNEVLKLIYESAALGGTFAYESWKDGEDEKYAEKSKIGILQSVKNELIEMDFIEIKEGEEQTYQEDEEDNNEDEQEEIEIPEHVPHNSSQYDKDQILIDEYFKSLEQRDKK